MGLAASLLFPVVRNRILERVKMRDFQQAGRSPARASSMMAATSHPAATSAALQVMGSGGNAVDGALAAAAILSVVVRRGFQRVAHAQWMWHKR